eukprot:EC787874.1.p2 GENE.EC787874.1~~EC787874.1.p2  ORF type:complete len:141 (+),score=61.85 EC787874.1:29-424(+)
MATIVRDTIVTITPIYRIAAANVTEFVDVYLATDIELVQKETKLLMYAPALRELPNGDVDCLFREGFESAEGVIEHLANIHHLMAEISRLGSMQKIECHGPRSEIDKLKEFIGDKFVVEWYVTDERSFRRV